MRQTLSVIAVLAALNLWNRPPSAQQPPPIPGETGTLALEGNVEKTYDDAHNIVVAAADGVRHLFHVTKSTAVHGTEDAQTGALESLKAGSHVVVHYRTEAEEKTAVELDRIGNDGLREMNGTVEKVDRGAKEIRIKLADGTRETLQLSERAAKHVGGDVDEGADVVVYYADKGGQRVAHYFKRK